MILFCVNTQKEEQARFVRHLFLSYTGEKQIITTANFDPTSELVANASVIVFIGFLRGDGLIFNYCTKNNKNFLFIDHAYLHRGYSANNDENEWMRVTPNDFNWTLNQPALSDRWIKHFASTYPLKVWNQHNGNRILVLPPSKATQALFPQSLEWVEKTINEIRQHTDAPIYVREKPLQPIVDFETNVVTGKLKFEHPRSIEQDMLEAKCIVAFNSAVPVLGTIQGIPCYCSRYAASYPMNIKLDQIDDPPEPNRQSWLNQLVYHQYTTAELKNGTFWKMIVNHIPNFNK